VLAMEKYLSYTEYKHSQKIIHLCLNLFFEVPNPEDRKVFYFDNPVQAVTPSVVEGTAQLGVSGCHLLSFNPEVG
jgi:hypothetical protein